MKSFLSLKLSSQEYASWITNIGNEILIAAFAATQEQPSPKYSHSEIDQIYTLLEALATQTLRYPQNDENKSTFLDLINRIRRSRIGTSQSQLSDTYLTGAPPSNQRTYSLTHLKSAIIKPTSDLRKEKDLSIPEELFFYSGSPNSPISPTDLKNYLNHLSLPSSLTSIQIENLVRKLPIPTDPLITVENFKEHYTVEELNSLIQSIHTLLKRYKESLENSADISIEQINTVGALQTLLYDLAIRSDRLHANPLHLELYPPFSIFELFFIDEDPSYFNTNPEEFTLYTHIKDYFHKIYLHQMKQYKEERDKGLRNPYFSSPDRLFDFSFLVKSNKTLHESSTIILLKKLSDRRDDTSWDQIYSLLHQEDHDFFREQKVEYIPALAFASFFMQQLKDREKGPFLPCIQEPHREKVCRWLKDPTQNREVNTTHHSPHLTADYIDLLEGEIEENWFNDSQDKRHFDNYIPRKGRVFTSHPHYKEEAVIRGHVPLFKKKTLMPGKEFLHMCSIPSLLPHLLIDHYTPSREDLKSLAEQELFFITFFRTITTQGIDEFHKGLDCSLTYRYLNGIDEQDWKEKGYKPLPWMTDWVENKPSFHLVNALKTPSFQETCKNFIQDGIAQYMEVKGKKIDIAHLLFYYRLASTLLKFIPDAEASFYKISKNLENLLENNKLSPKEKQAVLIHLLYAYSQEKKIFPMKK